MAKNEIPPREDVEEIRKILGIEDKGRVNNGSTESGDRSSSWEEANTELDKENGPSNINDRIRELKNSLLDIAGNAGEVDTAEQIAEELSALLEKNPNKETILNEIVKQYEHAANDRDINANMAEYRRKMRRGEIPDAIKHNNPFAGTQEQPLGKWDIFLENLFDRIEAAGTKIKKGLQPLMLRYNPDKEAKEQAKYDRMVANGQAELVYRYKMPDEKEMLVNPPKDEKKKLPKKEEVSEDGEDHERLEAIMNFLKSDESNEKKSEAKEYKPSFITYKDMKKTYIRDTEAFHNFYYRAVGVYDQKGNFTGNVRVYRINKNS